MDVHTAFGEYQRWPTRELLDAFLCAANTTLQDGRVLTPEEAQLYRAATGVQPLPGVFVTATRPRPVWPWLVAAGVLVAMGTR